LHNPIYGTAGAWLFLYLYRGSHVTQLFHPMKDDLLLAYNGNLDDIAGSLVTRHHPFRSLAAVRAAERDWLT
jgi:hypothetical protein